MIRSERLDALRGFAVVWMVAFHFCFDLANLRFWRQDFYNDPFWTLQRTCIVTLFLFCAGVSQALAMANGQSEARFRRRWAQIAGCALLVSAGSAVMFPRSWISFGVLHAIAVMLILVRLLAASKLPQLWVPLAAVCFAAAAWVQHPFFDSRWTNWIGLTTAKPVTEDHVPLLPWLGVVFLGMAAGRWLLAHRRAWLVAPLPRPARPLALPGRWSLSVYMLHQPLLIGLLLAVRSLR